MGGGGREKGRGGEREGEGREKGRGGRRGEKGRERLSVCVGG